MKRLLLLCFALIGHFMSSYAQTHSCITDQVMQAHLASSPGLQQQVEDFDLKIKQKIASLQTSRSSSANYVIPVVVYIVHGGGPENITDTQVNSQINALNNYFDSYGVKFCLATKENGVSFPGGGNGIFRINNSSLTNHTVSTDELNLKATSTLSSSNYLRIWVVKEINGGGVKGYAILPSLASPARDGIVMAYDVFGDASACPSCPLSSTFDEGKILVHEVGHYLGLHHTFEGGCNEVNGGNCQTDGDRVCDTPPVAVPNSGCPIPGSVNSCFEAPDLPDLTDNYMDYVNEDCLNTFTNGQKQRMHAAISVNRSQLVSAYNHNKTGLSCSSGVVAGIDIDNFYPCINTGVNFYATNVSGASYHWDFGDGATSNSQNASHTFANEGQYTITLTVTSGSNSVSSVEYIYANACSPINSSQGNWYFPDEIGLDFSTGIPVFDNSANLANTIPESSNGSECAITQSNSNGDLLFYSDGVRVWNKNHVQINVGNELHGSQSSVHGAISVPDPSGNGNYYVFTTSGQEGLGMHPYLNAGFNYSIINVSGTTATMSSSVNVPVLAPNGYLADPNGSLDPGEGISAVAACDGYWILVQGVKNDNSRHLVVYHLTASGISYNSSIQISHVKDYIKIKASPNGRKVATLNDHSNTESVKVYDFNPLTGVLSNEKTLTHEYGKMKAISFSPNSSVLYASGGLERMVLQYNLASNTPSQTEKVVYTNPGGKFPFDLELGADGKVYILYRNASRLGVLAKPNEVCTYSDPNACLFLLEGPHLGGKNPRVSLPNLLSATPDFVFSDEISYSEISCQNVEFFVHTCTNSYSWNFGDGTTSNQPTPQHTYTNPGSYTVSFTSSTGLVITEQIEVGSSEPEILGSLCDNGEVNNYSIAHQDGFTYQWSVNGGNILGVTNVNNVDVEWSTLPGTLSVVVTNTITGCSHTIDKVITACGSIEAPTGLNCYSIPELWSIYWDDVPGAVEYEVSLTYNDASPPSNCPGGTPTTVTYVVTK